jgi:hypothetical protein
MKSEQCKQLNSSKVIIADEGLKKFAAVNFRSLWVNRIIESEQWKYALSA